MLFGFFLIGVGLLFKVAAAPFHNWAPDVYDGTPTIITMWLSTIPKISIFILLLELQLGFQSSNESLEITIDISIWKNLLLIASILSLLLGTILGLSQYRIKRLLTYSTISHVGFLLLALAINTEESIESFLFYIFQYSITNLTIFLVLLAFGYTINNSPNDRQNYYDIVFVQELKGQFLRNPLLSLSFALCLFSIAGIPPLIGFFAKQIVLYSSMHSGYYFLSFVAILVSVISASYYLRIVQVLYFSSPDYTDDRQRTGFQIINEYPVTTIHSTIISVITIILLFFMLHPTILLNSCQLLTLSVYT